jgi:RNA polymerase-binding transcription factor
VNLEHYRGLLQAHERALVARRARTGAEQQEPPDDAAGDIGDHSVRDEQKDKLFAEDELNANLLDEVRLALGRIADGSYGRCAVDDEPIDERRLEAVPWTRYCARHQAEFEESRERRTPSL